ncbi:uncharacterized protein LOC131432854 [Malaya genurostris]|uniref:uncharacterized protein LOC131432854 n=1 Tax=Malaya genurostris TaxID=325434 RepID=UPI0026F3C3D4|nr:uncharacterized protein LOC131432854 [Malaya genurostris]
MSEISPTPIMAMEPTSMVSSEVHQPEWDTPDATSGSFELVHHSNVPSATGSFVLTEEAPIVSTEHGDGSFVLKEEVPIVTNTGNDGSFVLKEEVPIVNTNYTVVPAFVEECVASIAPQEGFTPDEFAVVLDRNSDCAGLIGEIHKATILEGSRELHLLCKIPPLDPVRRLQFNSVNLFAREIDLYANLLPTMFEFQRQKGVTEDLNTGFFNVPRCFLTRFDAGGEEALILMEDLRDRDFAMWNKLESINYEHARLLMIQLGRFHALSFAMKDQRPDLFEACKVPDEMLPAMRENEQLMGMFATALDAAISILDTADEKACWKMNGLRNDFFGVLQSCLDVERAEPYAVLNHGDCWVNNLLFRYQDGVPGEVVLLDWQLARYGSPALDLLYFLFCCTDSSFREKHYDEMVRIYHTALKDLLEELGSEAVDVFPFTALLRQLKTFGKFAIILTAVDVPILCTDPTDVQSHGDAAVAFTASADAQQRYADRMGGVIRDAIKYGYL